MLSGVSILIPMLLNAADTESAPKWLLSWGKEGKKPGEFQAPIGIAIDRADNVFVADLYNQRVQQFDAEGRSIASFSVAGHPGGIAIGPGGNVFLADDVHHRIQVFSPAGDLLRVIGRPGDGSGQFGGAGTEKFHPDLRTTGPSFLAFDRDGVLFATEARRGKVHRFTTEGKFLSVWGSNKVEPGGFGGRSKNLPGPTGICVDGQGRVWVAATNHRVQLFTTEGRYLRGLGEKGTGPGQFHTPHGLAMDSKGNLYVVDTQNHRIQKFAP